MKVQFKSELEEKVYRALRLPTSYTSSFLVQKEVPWNKIFEDTPKTREAVDFYYRDLALVIEVHGEQHFQPVSFGSKDLSHDLTKYESQRKRDKRLRLLCDSHKVSYLEVHHSHIRESSVEELSKFLDKQIVKLIKENK